MVENTLQHLIYGTVVIANEATDLTTVLAISDDLNPKDADNLIKNLPINPLPINAMQKSQAVAYLGVHPAKTKQYLLARTHFQTDKQDLPVVQIIYLSDAVMSDTLNLDTLLALINDPIPLYNVSHAPLDPLSLQSSNAQSVDKMVTVIKSLLDGLLQGDFRRLLEILGAAIEKKIVIYNFPKDNEQRLALIQGLRLLVPVVTRKLLTFTSNTDTLQNTLPIVSFSDSDEETDIFRFDWASSEADNMHLEHPYIAQLLSSWDDDVIALVTLIKRFDEIAQAIPSEEQFNLEAVLRRVAIRHDNDLSAMGGEALSVEIISNALSSAVPMSNELRTAYMILLLEENFNSRDTQTAKVIADELDGDSLLDMNLTPFFNTAIEEQPDAVYAFIRKHLNADETEIDEKWLKRLHDSAQASINIAVASQSAETIRSWLNLIAREPLRYELSDILRDAIASAQPYTSDSPELAQDLLTLAVKRQPDLIDTLLADDMLIASLSDNTKSAILEFDVTAIEALGAESRNLFLLALERSITAGHSSVTSSGARSLWQIHTQQQTNTLPPQFRPLALIHRLVEQPDSFVNGASATLLTLALADGNQDDLFYQLSLALAEQENFADTLAQSLEQSARKPDDILQILSTLLANEWVSAQMVVDTLSTLLTNRDWDEGNLPLIEQLSRVMTQYPDTLAQTAILWRLAERSAVHKNEQMLKVALRRLLDVLGEMVAETQIVESIQRLRKESQWSANGRVSLIKWWRQYTRELGTGQLQKIDKLLDGKRSLEDLRAIIQTNIAIRRIIGNRTLEEFSEVVATTYTLLQALSEGFDPNDKLVDSTTIRNEIDARTDELPVELRPVLSTNLKELAQIVTTLSENRSKPSLIRSDDSVERQLAKGEQEPQSALDVMRWLSGYLDGIQKEDTTSE